MSDPGKQHPDPQPTVHILAIDDNLDNLITLKAVLRDAMPEADILTAATGPEGIQLAQSRFPDVILLDWVMPNVDGLTVCQTLKADVRTQHVPIIILTALRTGRHHRAEAVEAGAEAFLAKPLDDVELVAQIKAMLKIKAAGDRQRQENDRLTAMVDQRTLAITRELAERRKTEQQLEKSNRDLLRNQAAMLNLLEDLKEENETRRKTEDELVLARDAAQHSNHAKSLFLASMSHELRTPLNPILGFTELLAEAPNLTEEQRIWLRIVLQRGRDLLGLIGSVLDLSKIEANKTTIQREPFRLRAAMQDLAESVRPAANKKGVALECHVAAEFPDVVQVDGLRLRQVLLNLLTNAIKFTEHGRIILRVQSGSLAPLSHETADNETALLFSVEDTGIGIASDRQAAIFEAFEHADAKQEIKYGGAGLGLTIASRLIQLMGGRIWVDSSPGKGSTFSFTILVGLCSQTQSEHAETSAPTAPVGNGPLNILVVDDDAASLKMAEIMIERGGHHVQTATDGSQALAMTETTAFDLVLMDVQMPVMSGVEATRSIREREVPLGRHTCIIALTAFAMQGDRELLLNVGMDGYLAKPFLAAHLHEAIRTFGRKQPASAAISGGVK